MTSFPLRATFSCPFPPPTHYRYRCHNHPSARELESPIHTPCHPHPLCEAAVLYFNASCPYPSALPQGRKLCVIPGSSSRSSRLIHIQNAQTSTKRACDYPSEIEYGLVWNPRTVRGPESETVSKAISGTTPVGLAWTGAWFVGTLRWARFIAEGNSSPGPRKLIYCRSPATPNGLPRCHHLPIIVVLILAPACRGRP